MLKLEYQSREALREYIEKRINNLHIALEGDNPLSETQLSRGGIKELRRLAKDISDPEPLNDDVGPAIY